MENSLFSYWYWNPLTNFFESYRNLVLVPSQAKMYIKRSVCVNLVLPLICFHSQVKHAIKGGPSFLELWTCVWNLYAHPIVCSNESLGVSMSFAAFLLVFFPVNHVLHLHTLTIKVCNNAFARHSHIYTSIFRMKTRKNGHLKER